MSEISTEVKEEEVATAATPEVVPGEEQVSDPVLVPESITEPIPELVPEPAPSVGERLRAAREAKGMSAADVAAALKLSTRQIEALEAGDWSALPGNAFIRGFVRNYARAVQIGSEALLADLDVPAAKPQRLDPPRNVAAVMPAAGHARKKDYAAVLAGLVLVAIAVVAYFVVPPDFWVSKPAEAPAPAKESAATPLFPPGMSAGEVSTVPAGENPVVPQAGAQNPQPAESVEKDAATRKTGAKDSAKEVPSKDVTAKDASTKDALTKVAEKVADKVAEKPSTAPAAPVTAAAPAAPVVSGAPAGALKFSFAAPSWVEIRDRSGRVIFSQLNPAGSEQLVQGQPPFEMVVGNAAQVKLNYKGRNIELQPRSKDDVARVTVE